MERRDCGYNNKQYNIELQVEIINKFNITNDLVLIQFQRSIRGWWGIFGAISYKLDRNDSISSQIRKAIKTVEVTVTFKKVVRKL